MELILEGHGKGKTTRLIEIAAEEDLCIVCRTHAEAWRVVQEARKIGHNIIFPLTFTEFVKGSFNRKGEGFLIDDADALLETLSRGCGIRAIALDATCEREKRKDKGR